MADDKVLDDLLACIRPKGDDVFVEVGPGKGRLTIPLLESGAKVIAIERDRKLAHGLPKLLGDNASRCEVVVGDAAKGLPVPEGTSWRLAGNIPYGISSPLLSLMTDGVPGMVDAHLMLQKEFAERIAAGHGTRDYGRITVKVQAHFFVELLLDVAPGCFSPPPEVDSAVVRLVPNNVADSICDLEMFEEVTKAAFAMRRKRLSNALAKLGGDAAGMHKDKRAEELSVRDYVELSNSLAKESAE